MTQVATIRLKKNEQIFRKIFQKEFETICFRQHRGQNVTIEFQDFGKFQNVQLQVDAVKKVFMQFNKR